LTFSNLRESSVFSFSFINLFKNGHAVDNPESWVRREFIRQALKISSLLILRILQLLDYRGQMQYESIEKVKSIVSGTESAFFERG